MKTILLVLLIIFSEGISATLNAQVIKKYDAVKYATAVQTIINGDWEMREVSGEIRIYNKNKMIAQLAKTSPNTLLVDDCGDLHIVYTGSDQFIPLYITNINTEPKRGFADPDMPNGNSASVSSTPIVAR